MNHCYVYIWITAENVARRNPKVAIVFSPAQAE
jgi:hypothetical protein